VQYAAIGNALSSSKEMRLTDGGTAATVNNPKVNSSRPGVPAYVAGNA